MWKKLFAWLDERLGLNDLYKAILDRPEPKGNWWNTLGSASLFLFLLQGVVGIQKSHMNGHRVMHPLVTALCTAHGNILNLNDTSRKVRKGWHLQNPGNL